MQNDHYDDLEAYVNALGEALRTEYTTIASAGSLFGKRKKQERAVREAWKEVGVL